MDSGSIIGIAVLVGVAGIGAAMYYAIAWYKGVLWWLALMLVPVGFFFMILLEAEDKTGFDGIAAALPAIFLGLPMAVGGLIGGIIALVRKARRS